MAAFTEAQRVKIRHYMGAGALFTGLFPLLESAITTVQAQADGGARPDDSTQQAILAAIAELDDIETRRKSLRKRVMVDEAQAGGQRARIDPARGLVALRMEARIIASGLAKYLGFSAVLSDVYSPGTPHVPPTIGPDLYRS